MKNNIRKTAVVTGGSSGIGYAVVERLLSAGFQVGFFGSSGDKVNAAEARLLHVADADSFIARQVDLRSVEAIRSFFDEMNETFGGVGSLVNNAGISPKVDGRRVSLHLMPMDQWQDVMAVNLTGALVCTQCVLPRMMDEKFGRIVMVGSVAARIGSHFAGAAYVSSKAGLAGLTRALAVEYASHGITANTVSPGNVASGMTGDAGSPQNLSAVARIPTGRIGEPGDLAGIIAFLCSWEASFINGATVDVTGAEYIAC